MLSFKNWLAEEFENKWQFISSAHQFERLSQRTSFTFSDQNFVKSAITKKVVGLRFGEYGFLSRKFNKIFICEVDPIKKKIKVITVLNGDMKLKQGTSKIVTEISDYITID